MINRLIIHIVSGGSYILLLTPFLLVWYLNRTIGFNIGLILVISCIIGIKILENVIYIFGYYLSHRFKVPWIYGLTSIATLISLLCFHCALVAISKGLSITTTSLNRHDKQIMLVLGLCMTVVELLTLGSPPIYSISLILVYLLVLRVLLQLLDRNLYHLEIQSQHLRENARVPRSFLDVAYKKIAALTYFRLALICYFLCEVALRLMSILISPSIVLLGQVSSQFIFIMILCIIFRMQKPIVAYLSTRMDGRVIVTVDPLQNTQPNARSSSTPLTVNTIGVSALNQAGVLIQVYPIQIRSTDNIPISSTSSLFNPNATNSYGTGENSESRQSRQQASHLLFNGVVHGFNFVVVPPYSRINIGTERPKMELATLVKQSIRPT